MSRSLIAIIRLEGKSAKKAQPKPREKISQKRRFGDSLPYRLNTAVGFALQLPQPLFNAQLIRP